MAKMKVEVWEDVMCPFCYMGRRLFGAALKEFPGKKDVEIIWHSYQLNPKIKYQPGRDIYSYLAENKGQSRDWAVKLNNQLAEEAKKVGLIYNFDKVVVSNTFEAHRLIHMAKKKGLEEKAVERLFKAYFTDGKNIGDRDTLAALGEEIGLVPTDVKRMLASDAYADDVRKDLAEAEKLGIDGVPFYLINGKRTVIGAQPPEVFLHELNEAYSEWKFTR